MLRIVRDDGSEFVAGNDSVVTLGRDPNATFVCDGPLVSQHHAMLRFENGVWMVYDTGSTNGTFMAGRRVASSPLDGFTMLRLGHPSHGTLVRVEVNSVPTAASPSIPVAPPPAVVQPVAPVLLPPPAPVVRVAPSAQLPMPAPRPHRDRMPPSIVRIPVVALLCVAIIPPLLTVAQLVGPAK